MEKEAKKMNYNRKIGMSILIIIIAIAAIIVIWYLIASSGNINLSVDSLCTSSGGTVITSTCCNSSSDFPNMCLIGACGCSPENSHEVKVCQCPTGMCWDSTTAQCVNQTAR